MMKMARSAVTVAAVVALTSLCGGCMGLSLFSHTHTHYDGTPGMEARIKALEEKVQQMEQQATSVPGASHSQLVP